MIKESAILSSEFDVHQMLSDLVFLLKKSKTQSRLLMIVVLTETENRLIMHTFFNIFG